MSASQIHSDESAMCPTRAPDVDENGRHGGAMDPDAATILLAASVVAVLDDRGVRDHRGRVVIACPERAPLLGQVLIEYGIGSITSWNVHDSEDYSLRRLSSHNDVLVDLRPPQTIGADGIEDAITLRCAVAGTAPVSHAGTSDTLRKDKVTALAVRVSTLVQRSGPTRLESSTTLSRKSTP